MARMSTVPKETAFDRHVDQLVQQVEEAAGENFGDPPVTRTAWVDNDKTRDLVVARVLKRGIPAQADGGNILIGAPAKVQAWSREWKAANRELAK